MAASRCSCPRAIGGERNQQRTVPSLPPSLRWLPCKGCENRPSCVFGKAIPAAGTWNMLRSCLLDGLSEDGWSDSIPCPTQNLFFSAGCCYPVVFFRMVVLSCSLCCYLTQIFTQIASSSLVNSLRLLLMTKIILYILQSTYQILRRVNHLRTGQCGFHSSNTHPGSAVLPTNEMWMYE